MKRQRGLRRCSGAAKGFLPTIPLLNEDRGILLVENEVLALPEVQEQCAQFQVITVVSRGKHHVNYYRTERPTTYGGTGQPPGHY
jgi:hypothetical protein